LKAIAAGHGGLPQSFSVKRVNRKVFRYTQKLKSFGLLRKMVAAAEKKLCTLALREGRR
jgi:hypothetical protein